MAEHMCDLTACVSSEHVSPKSICARRAICLCLVCVLPLWHMARGEYTRVRITPARARARRARWPPADRETETEAEAGEADGRPSPSWLEAGSKADAEAATSNHMCQSRGRGSNQQASTARCPTSQHSHMPTRQHTSQHTSPASSTHVRHVSRPRVLSPILDTYLVTLMLAGMLPRI